MTTRRSTEGWVWSGGAKPAGNFRSIPCSSVCGSPQSRTLFTPGNRLSSSHFISSAAQTLGVLDGSSAEAGALDKDHAHQANPTQPAIRRAVRPRLMKYSVPRATDDIEFSGEKEGAL